MTNSSQWTPGDVAEYGQLMASADNELDRLTSALRGHIAERGEQQAMADMSLVLMTPRNPDRDLDLLIAALRRLASQDRP